MTKKPNAMDKMYADLAASGYKSNMRLTLKVMEGRNPRYFYDVGVKAMDDKTNVLSSHIIIGVVDNGYEVSDGHGGRMWIKNFQEILQPRFLEDFITTYGKRNVSVYEFGKYESNKETINYLLK